jgi:hypothetical protein
MTNLLAHISPRADLLDTPPIACDDAVPRQLTWSPVALEAEIHAVLVAPAYPGEQLAFAFKRKEQQIGDLFARCSVSDSRALHRRLTLAISGDELAAMFGRLVADRRARLLAFLADARRRDAILRGQQQLGGYRAR